MQRRIFRGACTAVITPFSGGEIDYVSFGKIIDFQIESGINALLFLGTTGEMATLSCEEYKSVIKFAVEKTAGRVPVIVGVGSNSTNTAIGNSRLAESLGADALLAVTPFYNKPTQSGMISHFQNIASSVDIPIILYNVPSRTGVNLLPETLAVLSENQNIAGIKEACGNISQIARVFSSVKSDFSVYSGNDDQTVPMLSLGGVGVISVVSNIMPETVSEMCRLWFDGRIEESAKLQLELLDITSALFSVTNPIPVKNALAFMGMCSPELRLPLCDPGVDEKRRLKTVLKKYDLI